MNSESVVFSRRCGKHPSLLFTGFCSSCLVERLSCAASVDRKPEPWNNQRRSLSSDGNNGGKFSIVEDRPESQQVDSSSHGRKSCDIRTRKTLWSLFHLDDDDDDAAKNGNKIETLIANDLGFFPDFKEERSGENTNVFERNQVRVDLVSKTLFSSSVGGNGDFNGGDCVKKMNGFERDGNSKEKGASSWLFGSVFSRRFLKWRMKNASKKKLVQEHNGGSRQKDLESVVDFRRSCDHRMSFDSKRASWEDPRHSWDGFLIGKSFTQSLPVVGEVQKENSMKPLESYGANDLNPFGSLKTGDCPSDLSVSPRRKLHLSQESRSEASKPNTDETSKISPQVLDEKRSISAETVPRDPFGPAALRKKCHGWGKAWNLSIGSPLWGSHKNYENVLDRSLSESWQELRRENTTMETGGFVNRASSHGKSNIGVGNLDGENSSKNPRILNNSRSIGSGDIHRLWPDRANMKKDRNFGQTRSVHYSSPRNLDNGLLRFYLTPLRSSRRIKSKNRSKTPRSLARSILGFP